MMINAFKRRLTAEEQQELDTLNTAVRDAIQARREWLDAKTQELSRLQPGDEIYDIDTGRELGTVSKLYRYWRDRDEGVRDDSLTCDYEYRTDTARHMMPQGSGGTYDNTSRQTGSVRFGTVEDASAQTEQKLWKLRAQVQVQGRDSERAT